MSRPAPFSYLSPEQQNKWGTSENYMANWQDPMQSQFNQNKGNPGWMGENPNAGLYINQFGLGQMGGAPRVLKNPDQPFQYDPGPRKVELNGLESIKSARSDEAIPTSPSRTVVTDRNPSIKPQELNSPTGGIMDLPFNNDSSSPFGMGSNQPNYGYSPYNMLMGGIGSFGYGYG